MKKTDEVLSGMQLQLHPEKTRVINARTDRFQFLGYEFWPGGRQPRRQAMNKLHDRIRGKTPRSSGRSLRETIRDVNRTLRGWYGYFRHSFYNVFDGVDGFVRRRLRSILRKFAKRRGAARGNGADQYRYPNTLFAKMGFFSMSEQHQAESGGFKLIAFPAKV